MKQLLELGKDYILEGRFVVNTIKTEKGFEYDWTNDKREKANGKNVIERVVLFVPQVDNNGKRIDGESELYSS